MAYERKTVTDGETVMTAALYDNLQDGIDEVREALKQLLHGEVTPKDEAES